MDSPLRPLRLRFGPFVLDTRRIELRRDGTLVPLRPKPFALLVTLASHPGTVLRKEDLFAAVWPGVVVSDDSLTQTVREVRAALGDEGRTLLRTVARHGYCLDAEVVDADGEPQALRPPGPPRPPLPSPPSQDSRAARGPSRSGVLALAAIGLAAIGLWIGGALPWSDANEGAGARMSIYQAPRQSLVVLPLTFDTRSYGGEWFSDTLTMDLTADLGQISGMFVISSETAFAYKGRPVDPRQVARELNVRYVVQGAVERRANEVRLDMALVEGDSGRQRWSERFELDRGDLPGSLRAITGRLSRAIGVEVYRAEGQRAALLAPEQIEADDLAMRGWSVWLRGFSPQNTLEALGLFEAAVARDPNSLRAWSGIGLMNGQAATHGWVADPAPARARQREALHQMERIDAEDMLTYFARVDPYYRRQDFEGLLHLAQTLTQRFPNHPWSHHQHASALMRLGRFDECALPVARALQIGPRDTLRSVVRGMGTFCHFGAGRYAESAAEARQAMRDSPTQAGPQLMLAAALWQLSQAEEARQIVHQNVGNASFTRQSIGRLLAGTEPRLVAARERLDTALQALGVP